MRDAIPSHHCECLFIVGRVQANLAVVTFERRVDSFVELFSLGPSFSRVKTIRLSRGLLD